MSQLPQEIIERVRVASDVLEIVSGYLTLRKKGQNYFGLCPFHHEKTPSFSVNTDMQIFHCFGCGAGGNVFTFIMRIEGLTFVEAVKHLAQRAGIALPEDDENLGRYRAKEALYFANQLAAAFFAQMLRDEQAKSARTYLNSRGITESEYDLFGIGYAPNSWNGLIQHAAAQSVKPDLLLKAGLVIQKESGDFYDRFRGRITFAVRNLTGQVVGFGARRLIEDNSPKYINSPETEVYQKRFILYGLSASRDHIRRADEVIIVEGYTDFTSLWRVGVQNAVATSGTSLTEDHARLLRRYTANALLFFDSDSAGAAAALRGADILLENGMEVKICMVPQGKDPDEFARQAGGEEVRRLLSAAVPLIEFKLNRFEYSGRYGSSSQKAELTRELLISVAKIGDPIRRSFLVRDLAERLHLEESYLWAEVAKAERQMRLSVTTVKSESPSPVLPTRRRSAEMGLLEISLLHPQMIDKILMNLRIEDILHPEIRSFFARFAETGFGAKLVVQEIITGIQDPVIAARLSGLFQQKDPYPKHEAFVRDCLINIHIDMVDERIRQVKERIKARQTAEAAALMDELRYCLHEREKIKQGAHLVGLQKDESLG